jgi:TonB-dependent starch-binding outer membrane protein SusC
MGGGDATGNYRFSLGYLDQQGIVLTSGIKRYSVGFNGAKKFINNKLNITSSVNLANNQDKGIAISENSGYTGDLLAAILKTNPTMAIFKSPGVYNQPGIPEPNPMAIVNLSKDRTNTLRALGNIAAELEIFEGLKFKTVLGFDQSLSSRKTAYSKDLVMDGISGIGRLYIRDVEISNRLWENYFTYDKAFGKTTLNAVLGYSYQNFDVYSKSSSLANFSTNNLDVMVNNLASANAGKVGK